MIGAYFPSPFHTGAFPVICNFQEAFFPAGIFRVIQEQFIFPESFPFSCLLPCNPGFSFSVHPDFIAGQPLSRHLLKAFRYQRQLRKRIKGRRLLLFREGPAEKHLSLLLPDDPGGEKEIILSLQLRLPCIQGFPSGQGHNAVIPQIPLDTVLRIRIRIKHIDIAFSAP